MRIDVFFTPNELRRPLKGKVAAVVDVLRATSTIVEALANGARSVFPTETTEDAVRLAQSLGRSEVLLCGERRARKIDGFDLGNSPLEFTRAAVADKVVVMNTTNGTPALFAGSTADRCIVAGFLNLNAVAADLARADAPIAILCAGREGRFALEDALCAGSLIRAVRARGAGPDRLNDAAHAATALERRYRGHLAAAVSHTRAARQIIDAGLADDIAYCLMENLHDIVPVMFDRQVTL
ncbi:MAG: 2-phosphosulfolactate phosphatase [Gemmatimonadota bacterium]